MSGSMNFFRKKGCYEGFAEKFVNPDGEVPDELLMDMLEKSYRLVLKGFSKKRQAELLGENRED